MRFIDTEALIDALDRLHERADVAGWVEAEQVATALGWKHPTEMPDGNWMRTALRAQLDRSR